MVDTLANTTGITGYHSLSFKALNLLNKELFESEMNQMQLLHELKLFDKNRVSHKGKRILNLIQKLSYLQWRREHKMKLLKL